MQVRLADWGIAVFESESSSRMSNNGATIRAAGAVGTEYWCAPEVELVSIWEVLRHFGGWMVACLAVRHTQSVSD
jgi:serine/threonine protein kinase